MVKANVAGVEEEKVEVTFEKGVLIITAEEIEKEKKGKKFYKKAQKNMLIE